MQINKIHNLDFLNNTLPDKCANLIIADPPYFEVKGSFDFIWKSFDDYLKDVEKWAIECKRLLADNGSLFWYGDRKNIAYSQIILDKYFEFQNHIYWQKSEKCQMEMFDTLRSFYCRGFERVLFYSNIGEPEKTVFKPIMDYIKSERLKCGWNYSEMDKFLNIKASSCFWDKQTSHEYVIPTKENWIKLQETGNFKREYEDLRREYEDLRREYEDLRRPFNNYLKLSDHMYFTNGNSNSFEHDTVKSEDMTRALILTCSRPNDLVLVPFSGSGTECAMAAKENRDFIGFDIEKKYVEMGNKRCVEHLRTQSLFS